MPLSKGTLEAQSSCLLLSVTMDLFEVVVKPATDKIHVDKKVKTSGA